MQVFISSLMNAKLDRKCAIEAIHSVGHNLIHIEAQRYEEDQGALKNLMVRMVCNADAFVGVYQTDTGVPVEELGGDSAVEFELRQMLNEMSNRGLKAEIPKKVLIFQKKGTRSEKIAAIIDEYPEIYHPSIIPYDDSYDLIGCIVNTLHSLLPEPEKKRRPEFVLDIVYSSSDLPGLLQTISEHLYTERGMNIDRLWGAVQGNSAQFQLSASWVDQNTPAPTIEQLKQEIRSLMPRDLLSKQSEPVDVVQSTNDPTAHGYIDLRVIDSPGQLNVVCKALTRQDLNIENIYLETAPPEFARQTVISLKVPLDKTGREMSRRVAFLKLESTLRDLAGVRAIMSRLSHPLMNEGGIV